MLDKDSVSEWAHKERLVVSWLVVQSVQMLRTNEYLGIHVKEGHELLVLGSVVKSLSLCEHLNVLCSIMLVVQILCQFDVVWVPRHLMRIKMTDI